jgi:hypothetical protein
MSELQRPTGLLSIPQMIWVWRATVEWYWQGKTEYLGGKPVPVPLCLRQISHEQTRARTQAPAFRTYFKLNLATSSPSTDVVTKVMELELHMSLQIIYKIHFHMHCFLDYVITFSFNIKTHNRWWPWKATDDFELSSFFTLLIFLSQDVFGRIKVVNVVRLLVLTTASMKTAAFWNIAPCSLVKVHLRFRDPYCIHRQGDVALMTEVVHTSETSV